jgi:hypothetical protein
VIRCAAPDHRLGVPRCGNLSIAAPLSGVVCRDRLLCGRGCTLNAVGIAHVTDYTAHIRPKIVQALYCQIQGIGFDIGERHFHARSGKGTAQGKANTACPACHECRLASQFAHDPVAVI